MLLVDTSVWVDFFRGRSSAAALGAQLEAAEVAMHPWILGELALGRLGPRRHQILADLARLPRVTQLEDEEVLEFVERRNLSASGLGWVDAHLLGSAMLDKMPLWSHDRALAQAARRVGLPPP